ncbi:MAG: diphosphomevalonate decarboxylase [Candidatus Micrarchaeaceae archaeon]
MKNNFATALATPNIALIKYWGRRDNTGLNLPNNSSISMTLDENLNTKTTVMLSDEINEDILYINKIKEDISGSKASEKSKYIKNTLESMKKLAKIEKNFIVISENNFPSGAGIASSASGAAALICALNELLKLKMSTKQLSIMARKISGSACRSVYGGIVKWRVGSKKDGGDSFAEKIFDEKYWKELVDIIAVVDANTKKVSSSIGHEATVKTSVLYENRVSFAEKGVFSVEKAIKNKDIDMLSLAVMRDSNNMHATMLDTWPPIMYLNDSSKEIMYKIHELNEQKNRCIAGYTFDAGPNAHIITTDIHKEEVLNAIKDIKGIKNIIESHQGKGPRILGKNESLLDEKTLLPKR